MFKLLKFLNKPKVFVCLHLTASVAVHPPPQQLFWGLLGAENCGNVWDTEMSKTSFTSQVPYTIYCTQSDMN